MIYELLHNDEIFTNIFLNGYEIPFYHKKNLVIIVLA